MKNTIKVLLLIFLTVPFFTKTSCRKKYEDDPWTMRFVNLEKRIEGEWHIEKILIDGVDSTAIIYVDSLQIFSIYIFSGYSNNYGWGKVEVKTYNKVYKYDGLGFIFFKSNDLNSIGFSSEGIGHNTHLLNNNIIPYGPINDFITDASVWSIIKLTKKEMHLTNTYYNKKYELFFKKTKR